MYVVPAAVVGYCQSLYVTVQVSQSHVAYGSFCLTHRLDYRACCGHGQYAAHVVLVFKYAFLEKLVCSRGSLARVNHYFHVFAAYFLPVGYLSAEYVFQLFACQLSYRVFRIYYYGQRVVGHYNLYRVVFRLFHFHLLAELYSPRGHCQVGSAFH